MFASFNFNKPTYGFWAAIFAFAAVLAPQQAQAQTAPKHPVLAYVDLTGKLPDFDALPWDAITHVNVAFAGIDKAGACGWMATSGADEADTTGRLPKAIAQLIKARNAHNPQVKLILSVGGWTMSYRFAEATRTDAGTQNLAQSCVDLMGTLGLDGLDYDWEYPTKLGRKNCPMGMSCASKSDPEQLTALLKASRSALDATAQGTDKPLSVAVFMVPGSRGIPYDVAGMDAYLTYWNIMAYDNAAPNWSAGTGFHAAVLDTLYSLFTWEAQGATRAKLNLGVPYYGYVWYNTPSATLGTYAPDNGKNAAQLPTPELLQRYGNDPCCKLYNDANGDYFFCASGPNKGAWTAVDTVRVLAEKASFVRQNGFGGVMIWSVQMDNAKHDLTHTLFDNVTAGAAARASRKAIEAAAAQVAAANVATKVSQAASAAIAPGAVQHAVGNLAGQL